MPVQINQEVNGAFHVLDRFSQARLVGNVEAENASRMLSRNPDAIRIRRSIRKSTMPFDSLINSVELMITWVRAVEEGQENDRCRMT